MVEIANQKTPYYVRQNHFDNDRMAGSVPVWKHNESAQSVPTSTATLSLADGVENIKVTAPSLSFGELLDIVNPLHHLPIVGNVYRELTDDKISAVARVSGGLLYGGPLGGAVSLANAAIEEHAGEDIASAVASGVSSKTYSFDDESRTAGLSKKSHEIALTEVVEKEIQVSELKSILAIQKPVLHDIFDQLNQDMKPVTRVVIAENTSVPPVRTRGFNA